ncbi:MAG: hypothetical protein R3C01_12960 [Planctomycetaceae bacterium]
MRRVWIIGTMAATMFAGASAMLRSDEPAKPTGVAETLREQKHPSAEAPEDQVPEGEQGVDHWMKVKQRSAEEIFASLTNGDFKQLETSARRMQLLNVLEQWRRDHDLKNDSHYQAQLNAFEFATKELIRTAKDKDIDGALNSYVDMTRSCVRCHQAIRDGVEK